MWRCRGASKNPRVRLRGARAGSLGSAASGSGAGGSGGLQPLLQWGSSIEDGPGGPGRCVPVSATFLFAFIGLSLAVQGTQWCPPAKSCVRD